MNNQQISARILRLAAMMTLLDENPFKIRAFEKAARIINESPEEMGVLIDEDRLKLLPGIGDSLSHHILHYAKSGGTSLELELESRLPDGLPELLDLPGLGLKKVQILWREHGIENMNELLSACQNGQLSGWKGFGSKLENQLLEAIAFKEKHIDYFHLDLALQVAEKWLGKLHETLPQARYELVGTLRRRAELISRIEVLSDASMSSLCTAFPYGVEQTNQHGSFLEMEDGSGLPVLLWSTPSTEFYTKLLILTGGETFLSQINPETLTSASMAASGQQSEADVCLKLGLQWIEPELRDVYSSFPDESPLIQPQDIQGIFHAHSTWSDGRNSLEEMAAAVAQKGYQYFGISEHSQAAYYANGLQIQRVREQWERIDALNESHTNFHIFKGIEADILKDGALDYNEVLLAGFDFVIASIHSHFHLSPVEQTNRIIRALQSPFTTILGHPTGRMLLAREGYQPDIPAIIECAAEFGKVIEINTTPKRLDLDWRYLKLAREQGVQVSINPDAHRIASIDTVHLGVMMARKGGLGTADVINTMSLNDMQHFLAERRQA